MKLHYVTGKFISEVSLLKDGNASVGISVKGASKYRARPTVKSTKIRSLAHKSHCVSEGDVLVSVCGRDARGMSEGDVRRAIRDAEPRVELRLEYELREPCLNSNGVYRLQQMNVRLRKDQGSFGFVVRKNGLTQAVYTEYPLISNVRPDGPAGRDGRMMGGDRLMEIDGQSLSWLSLSEVADILTKKDEATFLVEYNICIADSYLQSGEVTELVIDCPDADLGITLSSANGEDSRIVIDDIRQGSLAERCGAFHLGDTVLYINDITTNVLLVPKAMSILHRFRKEPGKITYLPTLQKYKRPRADTYLLEQAIYSDKNSDSDVEQRLLRHPTVQNMHFNSPSSLYRPFLEKNDPSSDNYVGVFYDFQIKTLNLCQDIVQNVSNLQHLMPFLERKIHESRESSTEDNSAEINEEDSSHIDVDKFSQLKAACTRAKDSAFSMTLHLTRHSTGFSPNHESHVTSRQSNYSFEATLKQLSDNLVEIPKRNLVPNRWVKDFFEGTRSVDSDCRECYEIAIRAVLTTQKIILLLSLSEHTSEVRLACNQLLLDLTQMMVPCYDCSILCYSASQTVPLTSKQKNRRTLSRKKNHTVTCVSKWNDSPNSDDLKTNIEPRIGLNVDLESVRYTVKVDSVSGSSSGVVTDELPEYTQTNEQHLAVAGSMFDVENRNSNNLSRKVLRKKGFPEVPKLNWKSAEVISCATKGSDEQPFLLSKSFTENRTSTPKDSVADCMSSDGSSTHQESSVHRLSNTYPKKVDGRQNPFNGSLLESRFKMDSENQIIVKTQSNTVEVKLKDSGKGFGLFLGYLKPSAVNHCQLPVVTAIQGQSPAYKCGVLQVGDRVLEINGQTTIGLPVKELENLKKEAFSSNQIIIMAEFDVNVRDTRFGTFDVTIDKNARTGLEFKDFQDGQPLVVKGLVKGSSAHRSGLIHPGDRILYTNCIRQESFDSVKSQYEKKSMVTMTIKREPLTGTSDPSRDPHDVHTSGPSSFVRGSRTFNVTRTSIHSLEGSGDLVLEHEVTLFRDPDLRDFGFLLEQSADDGQVRVTGIRPEGPADASRVIKRMDRIVEVNEINLEGYKEESIFSLLRQTGSSLKLRTRRILSQNR